jgi:phosphohistidine phosphatase SixA
VIYLARHATPDRSRPDIPYQVLPGPDLTEHGRREARELGAFFQSQGVRHILASPFERAWRTARIAGEVAGAPVEHNADITEWSLEETEKAVEQRVLRALELACQVSLRFGSPVALVSHGSPVLSMVKQLGLGTGDVERHRIYDSRNLLPPAGAWEVRSGLLRLAYVPQGVRWPAASPIPAWF